MGRVAPPEAGTAAATSRQLQPLRLLLLEDSEDDAALVRREFSRGGYDLTVERVDTPAAMKAALERGGWELIIADYTMPQFSAPAALALLQQSGLDVPFIIVSGAVGEDAAVAAMKAGAHDYIMKGNLARLVSAVERQLREAVARREHALAQQAQREEADISAALARVGRQLIASIDTPAFLEHLCRVTAEELESDSSHTLTWQPQDDVYIPSAGYGTTPEEQAAARLAKVPQSMVSALLSRFEHDDVTQLNAMPTNAQSIQSRADPGNTVQLCIALRRGKQLVGIQVATRRDRRGPFTTKQLRIARGIAQMASLAIVHARLVDQLERTNRLKSQFVATISHELRTPLVAILGYNDLLHHGEFGLLGAEQLEAIQRMDASARALLELVGNTLDLSRLEAGQLPLVVTETRVSELIDALKAASRELPQTPSVRLVWNVAADLPQPRTDPEKLKVVLKNVIANAVKFTERGIVTVNVYPEKGGVTITVADTGIGIAPEVLPIIFEPFRQVDSSNTRRHGGVGLGLYIARRLLDLLGGVITVESQLGRGSTFRIWVPPQPDADIGLPRKGGTQ